MDIDFREVGWLQVAHLGPCHRLIRGLAGGLKKSESDDWCFLSLLAVPMLRLIRRKRPLLPLPLKTAFGALR